MMSIRTIAGGRLVKVTQSTPVLEVAQLMSSQRVGAVLVTDGAKEHARLVGIITDRDIVNAQLDQAKDLGSLSAAAVMTRNVLTVTEEETIERAIAHMLARGVRRAPIVAADGSPVGLVSTDDLIAQVSRKLFSIAGIMAQQSQCIR